jgi:hypothetical protein
MFLADRTYTGSTDQAFKDFVTSGQINNLDQILCNKFNSTLGISFAKGTFTALLVGWYSGKNFNDNITITAKNGSKTTVESLKNIYIDNFTSRIGGWLDGELGLPSGTAYNVYKMYTGLRDSENALTLANAQLAIANENEVEAALSEADGGSSDISYADAKKNADAANTNAKSAQTKVATVKASLVTFVITTVFADQLTAIDQSLGLVPGSMSMIVGQAVGMYYGVAINPWLFAAMFIATNLFGVYKIDLSCTADGYYPEMQSPPSDSVSDNGHLGVFDGLKADIRKANFVKAAQYKARTLIGDALALPAKFNDQRMTPSQIMTGRTEDVDYWFPTTAKVIYQYTGFPDPTTGLLSSRAGVWQNPQTTMYTHIGF